MVTRIRDDERHEKSERRLLRPALVGAAAALAVWVVVAAAVGLLAGPVEEEMTPFASEVGLGLTVVERQMSGDMDAVLAPIAPDAEIAADTARDLEGLRDLYEFQFALETERQVSGCEASPVLDGAVNVSCDLRVTDAMFRLADNVIPGRLVFAVDDGRIVRWYENFGAQTIWVPYYEAFAEWMQAENPEVAAEMFTEQGGFVFSAENGELMTRYAKEFPASGSG